MRFAVFELSRQRTPELPRTFEGGELCARLVMMERLRRPPIPELSCAPDDGATMYTQCQKWTIFLRIGLGIGLV